jgi:hypothetical protein
MAQIYGPSIVKRDLVLTLDAADKKSYPGSGTTWYDISGNEKTATGGDFQVSSNGRYSLFSGTQATVASSDILNTNYHSVFMIVRFKATGTYTNGTTGNFDKFFTYAPSGTDRSPGVWRYPNNRIIHWRYDPDNSGCDFLDNYGTGTDFALNRDYFVGVTKNAAIGTPYVNGVQVPIYGGGAVSYPKTAGNATIVFFENYPSSLMEIKNCLIYSRALSSAEVYQNYLAFKTRLSI